MPSVSGWLGYGWLSGMTTCSGADVEDELWTLDTGGG